MLSLGGCLTLDPMVESADESAVFENVTVQESWSTGRVSAKITLHGNATTELGVRRINVISANGGTYWTGTVQAGQTSTTAFLPADGTVTLVAVNSSNAVVETYRVTVNGTRIP